MKQKFFQTLMISLVCSQLFMISNGFALSTNEGYQTQCTTYYAPSYRTSFEFQTNGGPGEESSEAAIEDNRGKAQAQAWFDPELLTPALRAKATHLSSSNDGASSFALAIQGYHYSGVSDVQISLSANLSGSVINDSGNTSNGLKASVYIFDNENFMYCQDIGTLLYEAGAKLLNDDSEMKLFLQDTINAGSEASDITFTLTTGDVFYLWIMLNADAERDGSTADGELNFIFSTIEGLSTLPEMGRISGQVFTGITGNRASISGAVAQLLENRTTVEAVTYTDEGGNYEFQNVVPGQYSIRIQMDNFKSTMIEDIIAVKSQQTIVSDCEMKLLLHDVNFDGQVGLEEAIQVLKIMTGE